MAQKKSAKSKILIVEDDEDTRAVYCKLLSMNGFETVCAVNGKEGLDEAVQKLPDLILLDVLMPVMDGFTMFKELRKQDGPAKEIPVIILTNLSADRENIIEKVVETKPVYYLVKAGLPLDKLVEKVKEVLGSVS